MADSKKFENWAVGFSGCDGGVLANGGTWFCGIEWGGNYESSEKLEAAIKTNWKTAINERKNNTSQTNK